MEDRPIKIAAEKEEGDCSRWGGEVANGNEEAERTEAEKGEGEAENSMNSSSSMMLGLLDEFTKIYADRLQRVEDTAMKCEEKQYLANKVCVLEGWVRDLGEQNEVLVVTVGELEREAARRVALLEDRLPKMAVTTRQSCLSLRDHQIQVTTLVRDKVNLEKEAQGLRERLLSLERRNISFLEENTNLHSDLSNLLQVITRARQTGQWELDGLTFSCVTPEQVFGPVLSSSRRSSTSLKEVQSDYFHHLVEDQGLKKDSSSLASSFSNLQDAESSTYGGRGSEKDLLIMKLRAEVHTLQSAQEQANRQLVERDEQIADLQTQLTQNHQVLSTAHSETSNGKLGLTEFHQQSRKGNIEVELGNNIDSLVIYLREVENECRGLRDTNRSLENTHQSLQDEHRTLQDSHTCCSSVVTTLQDQLAKSHKAQDELRTVLTAEVAQRHDQIVALRDELKGHEQQQHEKVMQLQLKSEVIKELRKELRVVREEQSATNPTKKEDVSNEIEKINSASTQTCEIYKSTSKTQIIDEDTNKLPVNGMYSSTNQPPRLSKLENEVAEKSVLLRELQSHLAASRQELHLKDETLFKLEQKLDNSRRDGSEKGERMQYLTGQLTNLQLEVGRTHGQVEQLRRQVENKTDLIRKLEVENSSMTQQLNEKSNTLERYQTQLMNHSSDLDKKKREVCEQRLTISALQDALVSSKRACDQLRCRLDPDVSVGMTHSNISPKLDFTSNNQSPTHFTTTKSIPPDDFCPKIKLPSAYTNHNSVSATGSSFHSPSANNNNKLQSSINDTSENIFLGNFKNGSSVQPVDLYDCTATTEGNLPPDVRLARQLDQENLCQSNTSAFTPDVLSSCGSNSFNMRSSRPDSQNPNVVNHNSMMPKSLSSNVNTVDGKISVDKPQMKCQSGKVYNV